MSSWARNSNLKLKPSIRQPNKSNTIAITVCVNFADKLKLMLEANTAFLAKVYVVTDPSDKSTLEVCKLYTNVSVILCSDAFKNNAKFNKSGLIKCAQVALTPKHREDWIIIIDADTILPNNFWSETVKGIFSDDTVYLLKRKIYKSLEDVKSDTHSGVQDGCGFFQMYYKKNRMYGDYSESAGVCDVLFQQLFKHQKELNGFCIHLGQNGLDWNGRISNEWT